MTWRIAFGVAHQEGFEHFVSMFKDSEVTMIGLRDDTVRRRMEINRVPMDRSNLNISTLPLEQEIVNIEKYDVLIEKAESWAYNNDWIKVSEKWDIPRVYFVSWSGAMDFNFAHFRNMGPNPLIYANHRLKQKYEDLYKLEGEVIYWSADEWQEKGRWIGNIPRIMGLHNRWNENEYEGRCRDLWKKMSEIGETYMQDHSQGYVPEDMLIQKYSHSRIWFDDDGFGDDFGRSLTNGFVQALAVGLPIISWEDSYCSEHWRFIKNGINGIYSKNHDEILDLTKKLINDYDLAKQFSEETLKIYDENCSNKVIRPKWEDAFKRSIELWESKKKVN